ncbi:hypothetical protein BT96DRAFT_970168 [Gymnopus androsaceus JB14]|uniref:Uncharacterized protein n=1 Tax=Gymnopus androsaceus JB14 TaxID=1447944 RepID=A0A6A4IF88_9AGAR|nr:hypothetical protein BT96DRAFT_970168 [Gymnopus androsaceus JB14]
MTSVSSYFRSRKNAPQFLVPSKTDLQIIPEEEDEPRPSCSSWTTSSTCSTPELKRRRPISPYEIRIAKTPIPDSDEDFACNSSLLSAPRPAPRPPCSNSPSSSPDSFQLTFTDESFKFPHPPLPTPSSSDHHFGTFSPLSSPSSDSSALPQTPTTSDDEFHVPKFVARRISIRPLNIVKHDALPSMFSASPSVISDSDAESEPESDSEWYGRELSQRLTLRSALPPNFPQTVRNESARPESMIASVHVSSPLSSASSAFPSPQLDPAYPRRQFTIPSRPPPPPPRESLVPSPVVSEEDASPSRTKPFLPTFGFFTEDGDIVLVQDEEDDDEEEPDNENVLTYYVEPEVSSGSPDSFYSQPSGIERFSISDLESGYQFALDTDINRPMMLPLSLPNSPINLEADIESGLAELRMRVDAPVDEVDEIPPTSSASVTRSASVLARRFMRRNMTVSVPVTLDWNLSEEEEAAADEAREQAAAQSPITDEAVTDEAPVEEGPSYEDHELRLKTSNPALRSRWSSSTLSSIREEQQNRGWRSSKLRLYFGTSKKRSTSTSSGLMSPTTPSKPKADTKTKARSKKRAVVVVGPPSSASASSGFSYGSSSLQSPLPPVPASAPVSGPMSPYYNYASRSPASKRHRQTTVQDSSDDVMVIGYGQPGGIGGTAGVRRRGSTSTTCSSAAGSGASDASSILSGSSSASSGLRRKPIPVEMFLRA